MPACHRCGLTQATAEVRKTTRGHVCKNKVPCARRRGDDAEAERLLRGKKAA